MSDCFRRRGTRPTISPSGSHARARPQSSPAISSTRRYRHAIPSCSPAPTPTRSTLAKPAGAFSSATARPRRCSARCISPRRRSATLSAGTTASAASIWVDDRSAASGSLEPGFASLLISGDALGEIGAAPNARQRLGGLDHLLDGPGLQDDIVDEAFERGDHQRGHLRELAAHGYRLVLVHTIWHDAVDEAHLVGPPRRDLAAKQHHLHREL